MAISEILLKRLANNDPELKFLDLSEQIDCSDDVELLVNSLENNTNLKKLIISGKWHRSGKSVITDPDVVLLAKCKNIEYLDISNNCITDVSAKALALNTSIRYLNISLCKIGVIGLYEFFKNKILFEINEASNEYNSEEYAQRISNDKIKDLAHAVGINIASETLDKALDEDSEAKNETLAYMNNISKYVTYGDGNIENARKIKYMLLEAAFEYNWCKNIGIHLENNKAKTDLIYAYEIQQKRNIEELEKKVMNAIKNGDIDSLSQLIYELPDGVNAYLDYGCTLIEYALEENKPQIAIFLLDHGAHPETHNREKTILFQAAEKGKLEFVKLLLLRGGNITGEFYFNTETALTIAAFKMNELAVSLLKKYSHILGKFPPPIRNKCPKYTDIFNNLFPNEQYVPFEMKNWDDFSNPLEIMFDAIDQIKKRDEMSNNENPECAPWEMYHRDDLLFDHSYTALDIITHFGKREEIKNDENFKKAIEYATIYRLIHDKYAILKKDKIKSPRNINRYFELLQGQRIYRLTPIMKQNVNRHNFDEKSLNEILFKLNKTLEQEKEMDINWEEYPPLFIAQYRGIHYYENCFNENQRNDHIQTSHLGRMGAAAAVYYMSSLTPLDHQLSRESTLMKSAIDLRVLFQRFFETGEFKQGEKFYPSLGHYLQERMSSAYEGYKNDITGRKNAAYEILDDLRAHGYPHYASSDLPDHALRYIYGLKKVGKLAQHALKPCYSKTGKPKNPILGKIFIGLYNPWEMAILRMRHVAGMHERYEIDLKNCYGQPTIASERETGAIGGVDAGYVFYEEYLEVPDFSDKWDSNFQKKFGIGYNEFMRYKNTISNCEQHHYVNLEKEILEKVKSHKEKELLRLAQEEAKQRGGYLIYRPYDRRYSLEPEPIRDNKTKSLSKNERELMNTIGKERFKNNFKNEIKSYGSNSKNIHKSFVSLTASQISDQSMVLHDPVVKTIKNQCINQQLGWNCFDVAVGIDRERLIAYALKNADEVEFRQLLAPEIKHAAMLTYVYMLQSKNADQKKIKRIIELFNVADALDDRLDKETVQTYIAELVDKGNQSEDLADLARHALPPNMHTEELFNLIQNYETAHENMKPAVLQCNRLLGKADNKMSSLEELNDFFSDENNQFIHQEAFEILEDAKTKLFNVPEADFGAYCENKMIYEQYVTDYYGNQGWVAFQRSLNEEENTSMVDITARMLNTIIIINQSDESGKKEVYRTKNDAQTETKIVYNGHSHFWKDDPNIGIKINTTLNSSQSFFISESLENRPRKNTNNNGISKKSTSHIDKIPKQKSTNVASSRQTNLINFFSSVDKPQTSKKRSRSEDSDEGDNRTKTPKLDESKIDFSGRK